MALSNFWHWLNTLTMNQTKLWFFLALLLIVPLGLVLKNIGSTPFPISHIECQYVADGNDNLSCPGEVVSHLDQLKHRSLFFTDFTSSLADLQLEQYSLQVTHKTLPGTLTVAVEPAPPLYLLASTQQPEVYTINTAGFATTHVSDLPLPEIKLMAQGILLTETQLDQELHHQLQAIISGIAQLQLEVQLVRYYSPDYIEVQLPDFPPAIVDQASLSQALPKLAVLKNRLDLNSIDTGIKEIDLRFDLPVLRTQRTDPT